MLTTRDSQFLFQLFKLKRKNLNAMLLRTRFAVGWMCACHSQNFFLSDKR